MSAQRKQKIEETECCICVPGEAKYYGLSTDAALKDVTEVASGKKAVKRSRGVSSTPSGSSSSSDYRNRLRSSRNKPNEEDVDVKPTFPPPIDLTVNQDKCAVSAVPYDELRKKKYFIDKTDLICDMYMAEARAKYYCFPRAGTKSTVVSSLVHWLQYDDATRAERLKCFEGTKIMTLVEKEADGTVKDGAIGFNHHIVIMADFALVEVENLTFEEIKTEVTKEFCRFLVSQYSLGNEAKTAIRNLKANDPDFFPEIVSRVKDVLPQTASASIKRSVLLIIDNFDAPALHILNKEKSTELALKVMGFFNSMLSDVAVLDTRFFTKILLFGTHQPIGMNTKSFLKKIPVETYPYGTKEIVENFFFSVEEVKTVLKNCGKEETKVNELSAICGGYNIRGKDFFHPGCIINYITRQEDEDNAEDPVYWCSVDSLDILADTSVTLPYEMPLWLFQEEQTLDFQRQKVLIYENFISDKNTAYTYLLEGGYLTRVMNSNPPKYKIVNAEAQNLFAARYKQWLNRIPSIPTTKYSAHLFRNT